MLTEKQLEMDINTGYVIKFKSEDKTDRFGKVRLGWVVNWDVDPADVAYEIQVIDEAGDPVMEDGMVVEGMIMLGDVVDVVATSLDQFKRGKR